MKGYRLQCGIWNNNHDIISRDTMMPTTFETEQEAKSEIVNISKFYSQIGYEIWFSKITEIDARICPKCGKITEIEKNCWYCGEKH